MPETRPAEFRGRHFADEIIVLCVRWYLRYSLSYRDLQEIMTDRQLLVDHTTIWRWVQHYAPILNQRLRFGLKKTGRSWRVDETYVRTGGRWCYLYRAIDSTGATIDFYLAEKRDAAAAKAFLSSALEGNRPGPGVVNVDGNPSYPKAVEELRREGRLSRRCRCRTAPYLNNLIEQDHRALKRRINAKQGFRSFDGAWRTIQGYEAMHAIRKGQLRWSANADAEQQAALVYGLLTI